MNLSLNQTIRPENCSLSTAQSTALNMTPTLLACAIIIVNLFNLVVFRFWRNKPAYLLYHEALAFSSLLTGLSAAVTTTVRALAYLGWGASAQAIVKTAVVGFAGWHCVAVVHTLQISLDRWLAVEFVVFYLNIVTRKRLFISSLFGWILAMALVLPDFIPFDGDVSCRSAVIQLRPAPAWQRIMRQLCGGLIFIPILLVSQLRILWIVVRLRLARNGTRQVRQCPNPPARGVLTASSDGDNSRSAVRTREQPLVKAQIVARIVGENLLPSMLVVVGTIIANTPTIIVVYLKFVVGMQTVPMSLELLSSFAMIIQHVQSLLIYMCFFPDFRKTVKRMLGRGS